MLCFAEVIHMDIVETLLIQPKTQLHMHILILQHIAMAGRDGLELELKVECIVYGRYRMAVMLFNEMMHHIILSQSAG